MGLNFDSIKEGFTEKLGMAALKIKEASPELLLGGGIILMGAAVVSGIMAARKHDEIIDEHNTELEAAKATHVVVADDEDPDSEEATNIHEEEVYVLDEKEIARNVRKVYFRTAWKFFKRYALTAVLMALSTACFVGMHNIQASRVNAAISAYTGLREAFQTYVDRNIELNGEESHKMCEFGWHEEEIEDPETGEIKKVKVANTAADLKGDGKNTGLDEDINMTKVSSPRPIFVYNETTAKGRFTGSPTLDMQNLEASQRYIRNFLYSRGWCTLNDALDAIGLERVPEGMYIGWVKNCGPDPEFGLDNPVNNRFLAGYPGEDVWLEFNTHGNIYHILKKLENEKKSGVSDLANSAREEVFCNK